MSQAIIDETTLSNLGDVTRTLMSDDKVRTPDEMVADLSGIHPYTGYEYVGFCRKGTGTIDFADTACVNLHDIATNATSLKFGDSDVCGISAITFSPGTLRNLSTAYQMFFSCKDLVHVALPDGSGRNVTRMDYMCYGCHSLSSISLPDGFGEDTYTLMRSFANCSSLTDLTIPDHLSSDSISSISYMVYNCKSLETLNLPSHFGAGASATGSCFAGCTSLSTITGSLNLGVSFSLSYSPLTHDSLINVINSIQTVTSKPTLTLGTKNLAKLTDDEKKIATDKGWTLA